DPGNAVAADERAVLGQSPLSDGVTALGDFDGRLVQEVLRGVAHPGPGWRRTLRSHAWELLSRAALMGLANEHVRIWDREGQVQYQGQPVPGQQRRQRFRLDQLPVVSTDGAYSARTEARAGEYPGIVRQCRPGLRADPAVPLARPRPHLLASHDQAG